MQLLTYKTHSSALLKLGAPIVVGQLGIIVLSLADTLMVGRYGTSELAAASFVNNMFNLVIMFATGFSYGLTPIVGRLFGRKELAAIGGCLKNGLFANLLIALVLTVGMGVLYLNIHPYSHITKIKNIYLFKMFSLFGFFISFHQLF